MKTDINWWGSPSISSEGCKSKRKRTLEDDGEPSDRPAKARKMVHSTTLDPKPAATGLPHKDGSKMTDEPDSDSEKSNEKSSSEATESTYPTTAGSPGCGPRGDGDKKKAIVYKRDDFTGRIRPRRMMDDMYANASKEKMEKYKRYHRRYMSGKESTSPESEPDGGDQGSRDDDDDDDSGYDANDHGNDDESDDESENESEDEEENDDDYESEDEGENKDEEENGMEEKRKDDDHDEEGRKSEGGGGESDCWADERRHGSPESGTKKLDE